VHETVKAIQETLELCSWNASQDSSSDSEMWEIPVVLFPAAANAFSPAADGITFMMLMNSTSPKFLIEEQLKGATPIKQANVTPISMGYVVCAPGGKVGEVGEANLITKNDIELITSYAICAESYGFSTIYLEAGSGANQPVSPELIRAVRKSCNLTLLVGGGIRDGKSASIAVDAGADWIVTGNLTEGFSDSHELQTTLQTFITEMNS
ncbi:MAG TPA: phosphoglycerol geranylgeranyltransferase, partial [Candidatus Poseidoniales archaeon]|nr:phosphoglycerol geranylgeranyltransferase [Candidatus Poseidoniales archaeon]